MVLARWQHLQWGVGRGLLHDSIFYYQHHPHSKTNLHDSKQATQLQRAAATYVSYGRRGRIYKHSSSRLLLYAEYSIRISSLFILVILPSLQVSSSISSHHPHPSITHFKYDGMKDCRCVANSAMTGYHKQFADKQEYHHCDRKLAHNSGFPYGMNNGQRVLSTGYDGCTPFTTWDGQRQQSIWPPQGRCIGSQ